MAQASESRSTKRIRILLVEDNETDRQTVKLAIRKRLGMVDVDEVVCGEDAVNSLRDERNRYDVVILDYDLPGIKGTEVLSKLRELGIEKIAIGLTRWEEPVLSDMKASCAINAFCKTDRPAFIEYLANHVQQLVASGF